MAKRKKANAEANDSNNKTNPAQEQKRRKLNSRRRTTNNNGEKVSATTSTTKSNKKSSSSGPKNRMWIEQCKKTRKVSKNVSSDLILEILISRVQLLDDHGAAGTTTDSENVMNRETIEKNNEEESLAAVKAAKQHDSLQAAAVVVEEGEGEGEAAAAAEQMNQGAPVHDNDDDRDGEDDPTKHDNNGDESTQQLQQQQEDETRSPFIQVVRLTSAKGDRKHPCHLFSFPERPNGDCGDGIVNPYPKDQVPDKYWAQRKRLFSKFEQGIELDKESWYSVTPEAISKHIAKRVSCLGKNNDNVGTRKIVLDAFCGVGGNALGFALEKDIALVVCVDVDLNKLKMAAKNASVYDVDPDKILFIQGDAIQVLTQYRNGRLIQQPSTKNDLPEKQPVVTCHGYTIHALSALPSSIDCVFLSPPWGGTEYLKSGNSGYELSHIKVMTTTRIDKGGDENGEYSGSELLSLSAMAAKEEQVVCFLPRNINGFDIGTCAWKAGYQRKNHIELEQNILNAKLKAVTVYLY
eukprot:CAMPEP_0176499486 /NCGR_PEP_ID=MMETSP0200_2-20121128/12953_1 /TAXON_ID=947934 /ORGANISM="Chaetoceros sp., Strain GSL56" /LENGTH=520 /DNA_ID=CAMNT_0017897909 /DNA_START=69 /DNA_END=1631 /DNA_ORIENTATION=+